MQHISSSSGFLACLGFYIISSGVYRRDVVFFSRLYFDTWFAAFKTKFVEWNYTSENVSMLPSIINTIIMTLLALLVAGPLGIFAAIYMVEYAKKKIGLLQSCV